MFLSHRPLGRRILLLLPLLWLPIGWASPPLVQLRQTPGEIITGQDTTLGVQVAGTGPFTFQWYKDGNPIAAGNTPLLYLRAVSSNHSGRYHVVVTNAEGSTSSPDHSLVVTPPAPPAFLATERTKYVVGSSAHIELSPPLQGAPPEELTYQWYRNDVPLPGETGGTLEYNAFSDPTGAYHVVATNAAGSGASQTFQISTGGSSTEAHNFWSHHRRDQNLVYFMLDGSSRLQVYDLEAQTFRADLALQAPSGPFLVQGGRIYYQSGRTIRRIGLDGSGDRQIFESSRSFSEFYGWGNQLYVPGNRFIAHTRIDLESLTMSTASTDPTWDAEFTSGFAVAPASRRMYAVGNTISRIQFDPAGIATGELHNYNGPDLTLGDRSWVVRNEAWLLTDAGVVCDSNDLSIQKAIGAFDQLTELGNGDLLLLRANEIVRLGSDFNETGVVPLGSSADAIEVAGDRVFLFRQPTARDGDTEVTIFDLSSFSPRRHLPVGDFSATPLEPRSVIQDVRGDLLIMNQFQPGALVWSPASRNFTGYIPLQDTPTMFAYSESWDLLLIAYADGRVTQVDLRETTPTESLFTWSDKAVRGMVATDHHLVISSGDYPQSAAPRTYERSGRPVNRPHTYGALEFAVWNQSTRQIFQSGPGRPSAARVRADGTLDRPSDLTTSRVVPRARAPLVNETGDQVLLNSGDFFNTSTLQRSNTLARDFDSGVWLGGRLFTVKSDQQMLRLSRWGGANYAEDATRQVQGASPQEVGATDRSPFLFASPAGELALVTRSFNRTVIALFDENLQPILRQSHRGTNLLDDSVRLSNLSTRVNLPAGATSPHVVGFVIRGPAPMRVLLRAVGPGLREFGILDHVSDPKIRVFDAAAALVAENDDWTAAGPDAVAEASSTVGAFPLAEGSADAALVLTLPPGPYSVHVSRARGAGRNVLFEVYDYNPPGTASRLVNLSTRADAGNGDALIAGFVIVGDSAQSVLVRAVGAGLSQFQVPDYLHDPKLTLHDAQQRIEAENDNWLNDPYITEAAAFTGAFALPPSFSHDAAVLDELPPGLHTATVTDSGAFPNTDDFGNVLIEVYQTDF